MKAALLVASALLLVAAAPVGAGRAAGGPAQTCGAWTDPPCWAEGLACRLANQSGPCVTGPDLGDADGHCANHGVIVQFTLLGTNSYCPGSSCSNEGLIVLVGSSRSCWGKGLLVVCVEDSCWVVDAGQPGEA